MQFKVGDIVQYIGYTGDPFAERFDLKPNIKYRVVRVETAESTCTRIVRVERAGDRECGPYTKELALWKPTNKQQVEQRRLELCLNLK